MNNYSTGKWAEFLARIYMRLHGCRILCRNFAAKRGTPAGEIDFIALRNHLLIFVEVKKRGNLNNAAYAISPRQQQRIARSAAHFLQLHPQYAGYDIRFDAVLVAPPLHLKHISNAWQLTL